MIKKRTIITAAVFVALASFTACGGLISNNNQQQSDSDDEQTEETVTTEQTVAESDIQQPKEEPKAEPATKKWYEGDFVITHTMYVAKTGLTRVFARKGNALAVKNETGPQYLYVFTDDTRTDYIVSDRGYAKKSDKTGLNSVNDGIYKYLKGQLGDNLFKVFKPGDKDCSFKDTTIFGRPAYVVTKVAAEKNFAAEASGKTILHIDKENSLVSYKYGILNTTINGNTSTIENVEFKITDFSDNPTYDGLIMSLDGLTEITK